jgi:peptidoglycan/LPS O-acetylase OafA/YrhL
MTLSEAAVGRDNNYTLLRLVAALAVIVSHGFAIVLGGPENEPWRTMLGLTPGGLAVDVFFVISGFLVTRSLDFRRSGSEFIAARVLRIFPGLLVNLLFVAFLLGPALSTLSTSDYFGDAKTLRFVLHNLQMLALPYPDTALPGVAIANGSLWTLPVEVCCYVVLVAGWVALKRLRAWSWPDVPVALAALLVTAIAIWRYSQTAGFSLAWMFASGAVLYGLRSQIRLKASWAALFLALVLVSMLDRRAFQLVLLLVCPYLVFCVAYLPTGKIRLANRLGDYSYGTYIYGFPIQVGVFATFPAASVWQHVALSTAITLSLAVLSWHFVESPALKLVPRARQQLQRLFAKRGECPAP